MISLPVYNLEGKESEKVELKDKPFSVEFNQALVHQVTVILENNTRTANAHTKTKGEVRGGGKKPWKQKGTGRARAGSTRSPLWVGGGVTFGPRNNRNYFKKINKQEGLLALAMVIGAKIKDGEMKTVENWNLEKPKTKELASFLNKLGISNQSTLLVCTEKQENLQRAGRNLPKVTIKCATNVNTLDLLKNKFIVIEKKAITTLEKRVKAEKADKVASKAKVESPKDKQHE